MVGSLTGNKFLHESQFLLENKCTSKAKKNKKCIDRLELGCCIIPREGAIHKILCLIQCSEVCLNLMHEYIGWGNHPNHQPTPENSNFFLIHFKITKYRLWIPPDLFGTASRRPEKLRLIIA